MANDFIKLTKWIDSTTGFVTVASKIAYTTEVVNAGQASEHVEMTKSLADKLAELESIQIPDNLQDQINSMKQQIENTQATIEQLGDIDSKVTEAAQSANSAKDQANLAKVYKESIEATKADIEVIKEAGATFNTAFDADATFAIVTEDEYNTAKEAGTLNKNCIYFCYKV